MKQGSVIELEDNTEYAVADIVNYESVEYLYLVNIKNPKDLRFGVIDEEKVNFVEDDKLFEQLMYKVFKQNY